MTPTELFNRIQEKKLEVAKEVVGKYANMIGRIAQSNFNKFENQVSADADKRHVTVTVKDGVSDLEKEISCDGNQVIFIEFGVGVQNSMTFAMFPSTKEFRETSYDYEGFTERNNFGYRPRLSHGFSLSGGNLHEADPRPAGVVGLGEYGKGHGKDDYWVRKTNGAYNSAIGEQPVHKRNGHYGDIVGERTDVVWTHGHQPARALYRAMTSASRRKIK